MGSLHGLYRISFDIQIDEADQLDISGITQAFTDGFDESLLESVANLSVEKIDKTGKSNSKVFKIGDKVQITKELKIKASIYEDDGYMFIGEPSESSNMIGEQEVTISAGSNGYINKNRDENMEIIDLDLPVVASLIDVDTDELIEAKVNVDFITLSSELLEKVDTEEDK